MSSSYRRPTVYTEVYTDNPFYVNCPPSASFGRPHYNDGYFSDSNFSGRRYSDSHYSDSHFTGLHSSGLHSSGLHSSGLHSSGLFASAGESAAPHSSRHRRPPPPPTGHARERRRSFASAGASAAPPFAPTTHRSSYHSPPPPTGHARERRRSFASAGASAAPPFAPTTHRSSYHSPPPPTGHARERRRSFASAGASAAPPFAPTSYRSSYHSPPPPTRHNPRSTRRSTRERPAVPSPPRATSSESERSQIDFFTDRIVTRFMAGADDRLKELYEEGKPRLTWDLSELTKSVTRKVRKTLLKEVEDREKSGRTGGDMGSVRFRPDDLTINKGGDELVVENVEIYGEGWSRKKKTFDMILLPADWVDGA
ncbi:hypothetical protein B9479_003644 [Cryptococcus floricola]|uniref:Uncharacterized protein n=1 Tax=Cryptococcus floricola TaxID=2591691 RepID=A0A5D3AXN7_9TREE|nr:hypothetical protein B9479_003644 [Cryptococcus floricola]